VFREVGDVPTDANVPIDPGGRVTLEQLERVSPLFGDANAGDNGSHAQPMADHGAEHVGVGQKSLQQGGLKPAELAG
jgi:hypothetical protein